MTGLKKRGCLKTIQNFTIKVFFKRKRPWFIHYFILKVLRVLLQRLSSEKRSALLGGGRTRRIIYYL